MPMVFSPIHKNIAELHKIHSALPSNLDAGPSCFKQWCHMMLQRQLECLASFCRKLFHLKESQLHSHTGTIWACLNVNRNQWEFRRLFTLNWTSWLTQTWLIVNFKRPLKTQPQKNYSASQGTSPAKTHWWQPGRDNEPHKHKHASLHHPNDTTLRETMTKEQNLKARHDKIKVAPYKTNCLSNHKRWHSIQTNHGSQKILTTHRDDKHV